MNLFRIEKRVCHEDFLVIISHYFRGDCEILLIFNFGFMDFVFLEEGVDGFFEDLFALLWDSFTELVFYYADEWVYHQSRQVSAEGLSNWCDNICFIILDKNTFLHSHNKQLKI